MMAARRFSRQISLAIATIFVGLSLPVAAQTPAPLPITPHALGTVKTIDGNTLSFVTSVGQEYTVTVPANAAIKVVPPGSHDLKSAADGHVADIAVGDRVLVNGSSADTGTNLTAQRIIVMKASAIAQNNEAEEAEWAKGSGGIVKSVDAANGTITLSSGLKTIRVTTTPATVVRHYAAGSVKFEDAVKSTISAVQPGDQLRVRGTRSSDGASIAADEIVAGTFHNYSGTIASINPTASTISFKDLTTKKPVTVAVTSSSDVRRLPPTMSARIASRLHGAPEGKPTTAPLKPPTADEASVAGHRAAGRAGADLSQMLSRLPTETLAGLKPGDAVMIVATSSADGKQTAITLLAGVDAILAAPAGEQTTLSPWSVGNAPDMSGGAMQ